MEQRARPRGWFTSGGARGAVDWVELKVGVAPWEWWAGRMHSGAGLRVGIWTELDVGTQL